MENNEEGNITLEGFQNAILLSL